METPGKSEVMSGEATAKQIAEWKEKYKRVFLVQSGESVGYLKQPGRKELSYASKVGTNDPIKFAESIINNCWLGGDETIKTDDSKFMGVLEHINTIISVAQTTIKEV